MKDVMKMLFGGDFQSQVYNDGGMVDTKLTVSEVQKIAEATANALGSKFSVTKGSVDTGTFDLDYEGEKYDGGSYLIMQNGDVVNVALRERPIYYNYKTKKKFEFGGDFQSGVYADGGYFDGTIPKASSYMTTYAKGGSLEAHGIEIGDTFVKTISGNIQKIKDKNGKIVYVDLSTGERDSQPPLPFENGGGIGMEEDIDMSDDNRLRVRKPAMPNRKLSNQEIAEKYNASAYEYMETDKKAFGGGLFSRAKMMPKAKKYPDLEDKNVTLKNGKLVKVFSQNDNKLKVIEFGKIGSGVTPTTIDISEVETIYKGGGALVGNQKRIDMNKNGKIDAEDFKLLRSSMNGAWRNDHKHVNHDEDYEVRYARPRPDRKGYKGKRKFGEGGYIKMVDGVMYEKVKFSNGIEDWYKSDLLHKVNFYCSQNGLNPNNQKDFEKALENVSKRKFEGGGISNFERLSRVVAKNYEGKRVKPQYQKEYGKTYSKSEAKQVGNRVAGKMKMMKKAESGAEVKKGNRGGVMVLAKKIRKDGESWKDALKRAGQQMK